MAALLNNLVALVCVVAAAYTAQHGIDGWGWFLFVGAITANWGYTADGTRKPMEGN